jgi:hypothetical protein
MMEKFYKLSHFREFGLILTEKDHEMFISRFAEFIRGILYKEEFDRGVYVGVFPYDCYETVTGHSSVFLHEYMCLELQRRWKELLTQVEFSFCSTKSPEIVKKLYELEKMHREIDNLYCNNLIKCFKNRKKRRQIREEMKNYDEQVSLQDIFSVAIRYYVKRIWGASKDFRHEIAMH